MNKVCAIAHYRTMAFWLVFMALAAALARAGDDPTSPPQVIRRIDWTRFAAPASPGPNQEQCGRILLNTARWCAAWISQTYKLDERSDRYIISNANNERAIRPPASVAYGLAVTLKTGLFDEKAVGVSREELIRRTTRLIKGLAAIHKANPGGQWGDHWQSSVWAGLLANAAWLMWDDLDAETRRMVVAMTVHEADRHIAPGYKVPYWNGKGGDTKAEENAWETMILQMAVAMAPTHPHARAWREVCCELLVSAFARESDLTRADITLDGKTPREWLKGYNIREDGILLNHNIIHNDYMTCISLSLRGLLVCSLAGISAPQSFDFNCDVVYGAFQKVKFAAPPYQAPGGTMYIPGKAEQYYPQGTDWSRFRFDIYYGADAYADILGLDKGLERRAREWMAPRATRMLAMQSRFSDGQMLTMQSRFSDGQMLTMQSRFSDGRMLAMQSRFSDGRMLTMQSRFSDGQMYGPGEF
ncbi:MAG: hypothetical protein NTX50_24230, partial [Candidatus Sumerlaeota bacterium]|nr:hypothetical protein [Candidatus Sumerlaeota bacterium]